MNNVVKKLRIFRKKLGSDWLTCADASDGVCAGLEPQVARQGGDGGHEADDQGVGLDHLDRLNNDNDDYNDDDDNDANGGHEADDQSVSPVQGRVSQVITKLSKAIVMNTLERT